MWKARSKPKTTRKSVQADPKKMEVAQLVVCDPPAARPFGSTRNCPLAYNNRGNAYYNRSEWTKAIADLSEALALDPNCAEAHNSRGSLYDNMGQHDKAIADYTEAVRLDPKDASLMPAAAGPAREGRTTRPSPTSRTRSGWRRNRRPSIPRPRFGLWRPGRMGQGRRRLQRGHPPQSEHPWVYYSRGNALANKDEYDMAIADYHEAIRLNPKYAAAYYNRGLAYEKKRNKVKAQADFAQAKKLGYKAEQVRESPEQNGSGGD